VGRRATRPRPPVAILFEDFVKHGRNARTGLFRNGILLDDLIHRGAVGRLLQFLAKFLDVKKLGDVASV